MDRPLLQTRELDSYVANRSTENLVVAAVEALEANIQVEKLVFRNHNIDWFEEDNMEFDDELSSQFASSLRQQSLPRIQVAEFHNKLVKKQQEKYDSVVLQTTKMLNAAEQSKTSLRKTIKSLHKELEETRENWQASKWSWCWYLLCKIKSQKKA